MEDKNTYICGLRDEIEGRLWAAYNRGYDDGFDVWVKCAKAEEEYFSTIGRAFLQWISDKKNIVMKGEHNKENAKKFVYSVLSTITNEKEPEPCRVGDEVVEGSGMTAIITRIEDDGETASVLVTDKNYYGLAARDIRLDKLKRTGKHCDITLNW